MLTINSLRMNQIFIFGFVIFASLLLTVKSSSAQNSREDVHDGPLIHNFGRHVDLPNADHKTNTGMVYKVAFEILQALGEPTRPHMRLEAAARFMNMHAHAGVPTENLQLSIVLHGGGTRAAMTNEAYRKRYEVDNPSLPLLHALSDAGVSIYLCEQSRVLSGTGVDEIATPVKSALSAMTAIVNLQEEGYHFLTY
jgi:intracellular sulfur oxidation DsrE/DsrF family protein